ncbi:MAG: hypothetical protein GX616_06955 [Planctomycetes bacterium]|nr:hypothetical protein [Planctomycetota bacterium]
MTKSSSALLSLVAAVPAAFLAFLLVMAFLNHADKMGGTLNAVVGVALLAAVATALMPVGVLLFGGPRGPARPKAAKAPKPSRKKDKKKAASEEDAAASTIAGAAAQDEELVDDEEFETAESDAMIEEFEAEEPDAAVEEDWDEAGEGASDEFEFEDALSDDELDFDFDDEDK